MPKLIGIDYYDAVKIGIDAADAELNDIEVLWTGPTEDRVDKQIEMLEEIIPEKPDLIAVASNDPVSIVPVLKKAHSAGIRIMSWDGDTDFREFFVNLVNYSEFGTRLVKAMVEQEAGLSNNIAVIGNATPNLMRTFLKEGVVRKALLWNAPDHGYLTVYSAYRLLTQNLREGQAFDAGRLGFFTPRRDHISLEIHLPVIEFTKENVDQSHF